MLYCLRAPRPCYLLLSRCGPGATATRRHQAGCIMHNYAPGPKQVRASPADAEEALPDCLVLSLSEPPTLPKTCVNHCCPISWAFGWCQAP
ncbi:hypothetical protein LY78DRAFT_662833 [Colletotrichum sublineola]|nr:hypothetical protein LY78DRAFT_662833 [Colletotrichum sublineola]